MRLDELFFEMRLERHASREPKSRRIIHLMSCLYITDALPDELQMLAQVRPDG